MARSRRRIERLQLRLALHDVIGWDQQDQRDEYPVDLEPSDLEAFRVQLDEIGTTYEKELATGSGYTAEQVDRDRRLVAIARSVCDRIEAVMA